MVASTYTQELRQISLDFEDALAEMMGAKSAVYDASNDLNSAKAQLEVSKAEALAEGVQGSNKEEREANLRLKLHDLHSEVFLCEKELARVKLQAEIAKDTWDALRYRLRAIEAVAKLECQVG